MRYISDRDNVCNIFADRIKKFAFHCVLSVDILAQKLPPLLGKLLGVLNRLISIAFYGYMIMPAMNFATRI